MATIPGGLISITLGLVFTWTWYSQLYLMIFYQLNNISTFSTAADFDAIGEVKLIDMKSVPIYSFYYKNKQVMREDAKLCG